MSIFKISQWFPSDASALMTLRRSAPMWATTLATEAALVLRSPQWNSFGKPSPSTSCHQPEFSFSVTVTPIGSIQFIYELNSNHLSTMGLTTSHKHRKCQRTRSRDAMKLLSHVLPLLRLFPPFKGPEDVSPSYKKHG